jgi:hypothetical protein
MNDFDIAFVAFVTIVAKAGALVLVGLAMLSAWDLLKVWFKGRA